MNPKPDPNPKEVAAVEESQMDLVPSQRGVTAITPDREAGAWPCIRDHGILVAWDKREDRMTARIVHNRLLARQTEGEG